MKDPLLKDLSIREKNDPQCDDCFRRIKLRRIASAATLCAGLMW